MYFDLLTRFNARLARFSMYFAVAGVFLLVAVVTWQVFGRYVLNDTPTWAESLALVIVLYVTLLAASVGVRDAGHIGMESLLILLPEKPRHALEVVIHCLTAVFGVMMVWHGGHLALSVMSYQIPILHISEGFNHLPLVLAGGLIVLFSIEHVLALLHGKEVIPSWH